MKRISFYKLMIGIALLLPVLNGCSTAKISAGNLNNVKTMQPPNGKALVYLIRPGSMASLITFDVTCDDVRIGAVPAKRFIYAILEPGTHKLVGKAENNSELSLTVQADQTYFIEQDARMGIAMSRNKLIVLNEAKGRADLEKCKLSGDCAAYTASK